MKKLQTPFSEADIAGLDVGDMVLVSGYIFCGRDAVLPKIVDMAQQGTLEAQGIDLTGGVIFHTAVSPAGVGPTSSNKLEIEASMKPLSDAGIKMHLGKGKIKDETIQALAQRNAVYAVIPPVTALLESKTTQRVCVACPELGMEALYRVKVEEYPVIIAAAKGKSIY
jgi:fumarate hydratase subunit beta